MLIYKLQCLHLNLWLSIRCSQMFFRIFGFARHSGLRICPTVYIHFQSIQCIWMVSLFDLHPIAKTCGSIVMAEESKSTQKWTATLGILA